MRIIPKKIKVRNNVWKCYSMKDIFVALVVFALIFVFITMSKWAIAIILGIIAVIMLMPTGDGIFYTYIFENIRFAIGKKKYTKDSTKDKENIREITELSDIKDNGERKLLQGIIQYAMFFCSNSPQVTVLKSTQS